MLDWINSAHASYVLAAYAVAALALLGLAAFSICAFRSRSKEWKHLTRSKTDLS